MASSLERIARSSRISGLSSLTGVQQLAQQGSHREQARDFAGRVTAEAIGDHEQ